MICLLCEQSVLERKVNPNFDVCTPLWEVIFLNPSPDPFSSVCHLSLTSWPLDSAITPSKQTRLSNLREWWEGDGVAEKLVKCHCRIWKVLFRQWQVWMENSVFSHHTLLVNTDIVVISNSGCHSIITSMGSFFNTCLFLFLNLWWRGFFFPFLFSCLHFP